MNGYTSDRQIRLRLAWVAVGCCLVISSPVSRADQAESPPARSQKTAAPAVEPAQIEQWVRELDDDRYAVREAAQKQLAAAGAPALETVGGIAAAGSLESSTRAVSVLVGWADSTDSTLSLPALEKIAALQNRPIEAAMALERLAVVREAAAVEAIKSLGGRVEMASAAQMLAGPNMPQQVIIGPDWKGGVDGLKHVADLRHLHTLSLWGAPLDDAAVAELSKISNAQKIDLYGPSYSAEAIEKAKAELPNTQFDVRRSGLRLGIMHLPIQRVVPNSPAAKAGLAVNDDIQEFNGTPIVGTPIERFELLTKLIAESDPAKAASIKVLRGGETLDKSVTFDSWGDAVADMARANETPEMQQGFVPVQIQGGGRIIIQPGGQIIPAPIQGQRR